MWGLRLLEPIPGGDSSKATFGQGRAGLSLVAAGGGGRASLVPLWQVGLPLAVGMEDGNGLAPTLLEVSGRKREDRAVASN